MTDSHVIVYSSLPGAISDSLALVWREQTGRKPPGARTYMWVDTVVVDDLEATITGLEQALDAVNIRLNEIERRADRAEGGAIAAVEDLERKLGELGVLLDARTGSR